MNKKAIQGHPTRGEEIIQLLESFGGKNRWHFKGTDSHRAFYIDKGGDIYCFPLDTYTGHRTIYTLECFKKLFPFKIGDKITNGCEEYLIIDMDLGACDLNYKVRTSLGSVFWVRTCDLTAHHYKQIKEMKKERYVTLAFDKAKEWYKRGGELKEVALQAFSEEELTKADLPKTWEEFCKNNPIKISEAIICTESVIVTCDSSEIRDSDCDREVCPSRKSAEAHLALIQLEQLRDCWRQDWEPIWDISEKWCIHLWGNELSVGITTNISRFLTFPSKEIAKEFLKCFRDLIEIAKDLI